MMESLKSKKCLVCYRDFNHRLVDNLENNFREYDKVQKSVISKHLHVIFILKQIFELPSNQLCEYLQSCPNIEGWIACCEECEVVIEKCKSVYCELLEVTKRFRTVKQSIVDIVKSNYSYINPIDNDGCVVNAVLDITDGCRRFINQCNYKGARDPFIEGNVTAKQKSVKLKRFDLLSSSLSSTSHICGDSNTTSPRDKPVKEEAKEVQTEVDINTSQGERDIIVKEEIEKLQSSTEDINTSQGEGDIIVKEEIEELKNSEDDFDILLKEEMEEPQNSEEGKVSGCEKNICSKKLVELLINSEEQEYNYNSDEDNSDCEVESSYSCSTSSSSDAEEQPSEEKTSCEVDGCGNLRASKRHMSTHGKHPGLKCEFCNKEFYRRDHLKRHEQIHTMKDIRPHQCDICPKNYRRLDKLQHHKRRAHNPNTAKKPLPQHNCSHCSEIFANQKLLMRHMRQQHPVVEIPNNEEDINTSQGDIIVNQEIDVLKDSEGDFDIPLKQQMGEELQNPEKGRVASCEKNICSIKQVEKLINSEHKYNDYSDEVDSDWEVESFHSSSTSSSSDADEWENDDKAINAESEKKREKKNQPLPKVNCTVCEKSFRSKSSLNRHHAKVHGVGAAKKPVKVQCSVCGQSLYDKSTLARHMTAVHGNRTDDTSKIPCKVDGCGKLCLNQRALQRHMTTHGKSPGFKCQFCNKEFYRGDHLKRHEQIHTMADLRPHQCDICPKNYRRLDKLQHHKRRAHNPHTAKKPLPQHNCSYCSEIFTNQKLLMRHMRQQHSVEMPKPKRAFHFKKTRSKAINLPSIKCLEDDCDAVVSSHTHLEIHMATKHTDKSQLKCSECGKGFYTNEAMKGHTHTCSSNSSAKKDKPFTCEFCGSTFHTVGSLNSHKEGTLRCKLLHQDESEATIVCEQCGRKFAHTQSLELHVKTVHEGKYKFTCEQCGQGFSQTNKLKAHLFVKHQIGDGGPLYLKCPEEGCDRAFYVKKRLEKHLNMEHKCKPPYKCDECGKQYNCYWKLGIHNKAVHGGGGEK